MHINILILYFWAKIIYGQSEQITSLQIILHYKILRKAGNLCFDPKMVVLGISNPFNSANS